VPTRIEVLFSATVAGFPGKLRESGLKKVFEPPSDEKMMRARILNKERAIMDERLEILHQDGLM
jgi:hypothetical protein